MPVISLFCGPGGLDEGFKQAGFTTLLAYDNDRAACETHRHNHPEARAKVRDLSAITIDDVVKDWNKRSSSPPVGVIGGPPCQSFSVSNVFQKSSDPRNQLPEHYARILGGLMAKFAIDFFVFENVPGLLSGKHAAKYEKFKRLFQKCGFTVFEAKLDAQYFGVAQVRERVFIVGLNSTKYKSAFTFPEPVDSVPRTVRDAIANLPHPTFFDRKLLAEDIPFHPNHWCLVPRSKKFGSLKPGEIKGRSLRVLLWDKPSYTVAYGHREVHVHPDCLRRLSVFEAMCLQGFPREYVLKGTLSDQIRLVSEAVPPPLSAAIAKVLSELMDTSSSPSPVNKKKRVEQSTMNRFFVKK